MEDNDISVSLTPEETTAVMGAIVAHMKILQCSKKRQALASIVLLGDVSMKIQEAIQVVKGRDRSMLDNQA